MTAKRELLGLARELRARVALSHEAEWGASAPSGARTEEARTPSEGSTSTASTSKYQRLESLCAEVNACRKCPLGSQRLNPAFGVGDPDAKVMFIGEGPGYEEDRRGEPFVGRAGQLLDKILASIGLSRGTVPGVYIANVVKCHPMKDPSTPEARGNDRAPTPEESAACRGYLDEQIRLIAPRVIVTLGAVATRAMLGSGEGISKIRGRWREYRSPDGGTAVKLLPTYHPAALLRDPNLKRDVWTDMKNLKLELETT